MDKKRPVVWVIQENNHNYSPAELFGTVRFITRTDFRSFTNSSQNIRVRRDISTFLKEYKPNIDFVIPAGNPITVILVSASLPKGYNKFLKWNGRESDYEMFNINL